MSTKQMTARRSDAAHSIGVLKCLKCDAVLQSVGEPNRPITSWNCSQNCGAPAHTFNRDTKELCCSRFVA
jgi:hypothetical protein